MIDREDHRYAVDDASSGQRASRGMNRQSLWDRTADLRAKLASLPVRDTRSIKEITDEINEL